ncbi:hypothetical protein HDU81_005359, partial [Chytriomyces hyalinus]
MTLLPRKSVEAVMDCWLKMLAADLVEDSDVAEAGDSARVSDTGCGFGDPMERACERGNMEDWAEAEAELEMAG